MVYNIYVRLNFKNIIIGAVLVGLFSLFAFGSSSNENKKTVGLKSDLKQTQQEDAKAKEYEREEFDQKMKELEASLTNPPITEESIQQIPAKEINSTSENGFVNNTSPQEANTSNTYSSSFSEGDKDCGDFATHAEAQAFFEAAGPGDPHRLDRDGDDLACEDLP
jgi:hypothetical protein